MFRRSVRQGCRGSLRRAIRRAARFAIEPMEARLLLAADPIITEFMADNRRTLKDSFGDYSDWIELYNPDTAPASLDGWYLSTDATNPYGWQFPNVTLQGGQYLIVFASGRDRRNPELELHTDFTLPASGGYLALVKPDGITKTSEYPNDGSALYPKQVPDVSYGVVMQGSGGSLVGPSAAATALVPTSDIGTSWQTAGYNDTSWVHSSTGVGFDRAASSTWGTWGQYGPGNTWNLYQVISTPATWPNAYAYARSRSWGGNVGHLVTITSSAENAFIKSLISADSWVGLTDDSAYGTTEGNFIWCSGETGTYRNWASGQPNNTSGGVSPANFARLLKSSGTWNDDGASQTFSYVIEYDLNLPSQPTSDPSMPRRFQVVEVDPPEGTYLNSVTDADDALASGAGTVYSYLAPYVNFCDGLSGDANFESGTVFKSVSTSPNDYALQFTGSIKIATAGDYTFLVNSDDGFRLTIDGASFRSINSGGGTIAGDTMSYESPRGPADSLGVTALAAGEHFVTLTFFQRGGGSEIEFAAASGAKTTYDSSFTLVGDTANGGLPLVGISDYISTNIEQQAYTVNSSAYVRVPFTMASLDGVGQLTLKMKYDDGFVAYINGHEIARSDSVDDPIAWNSTAEKGLDSDALMYEVFDVSAALQYLTVGANVLAIQVMNASMSDSTMLALPELSYSGIPGSSAQETYLLSPTPGKINSEGNPNLGPLIWNVARSVTAPGDADDVVITAEVRRALSPVSSVVLHYLVNFGTEAALAMYDDGAHGDGSAGDNVYGATIPASGSTPGQMVRYYVTAVDNESRSSRWPIIPSTDPDPSSTRKWPIYEGFMIADPSVTSTMPILWWFIQNPSGATNRTGTRASVWFNGEFYDNIFCRSRGGSATGGTKFDFNRGYYFKWDPTEDRVSEINLNFKGGLAPDDAWIRPVITFETFRDAGSPSSASAVWRVQQNGSSAMFRIFVEEPTEDYLDRQGFYKHGALYKTPNADNPRITSASYFEKKYPNDTDKSDLQAFLDGIHNSDLAARQRFLLDNFDIARFIDYQAATVITEDLDCVQKNYFLYRDTNGPDNPNGSNKWMLLPWDKHLTFGKSFGISDYNAVDPQAHPFYGDSEHPKIDSSSAWNWLIDALLDTPVIKQMYLRRLRTVMDQLLNPISTPYEDRYYETRLDALYNMLMGDATFKAKYGDLTWAFDDIKNKYLTRKRNHLYVDHSSNTAYLGYAGIPGAQPDHPPISFGTVEVNPASGNQDQEYIELRNPNSYAVDISDWKLEGGVNFTFKLGTVIPASSSIYVSPNVCAFLQRTTGPSGNQGLLVVGAYDGHLSTRGETLILKDGAGDQVATYTSSAAESNNQKYLRITEVMYNPADPASGHEDNDEFEFVELKNISTTQTLSLSGVTFTDGIDFTFGTVSLAPGQYVLVVKNRVDFESRYGTGFNIAGEYPYKYLDNGQDRIRLADANGEEILEFTYKDTWYPATDHTGHSLVMSDATLAPATWGDPANWRPSTNIDGSPGAADPDQSLGAPWVHIVNVMPGRSYASINPVNSITIQFSKPVTGFGLEDLTLTRDGVALTLAAPAQTLALIDSSTYRLDGLGGLTSLAGEYILTLGGGTASGIYDSSFNLLIAGDSDIFHVSTAPLSATITQVLPDPRTTSASPIVITFNRAVDHFGLSDLRLTRDGGANLLTGFERLVSTDDITWRLSGLTSLTTPAGVYVLSLDPALSNITDKQGFALINGDSEDFTVDQLAPTVAAVGPVTPDPRSSAVPYVDITFSEPVLNVDWRDFSLTRDGGTVALSSAQTTSPMSNGAVWRLENLSGLTSAAGSYVLTLVASGSGIADLVGNLLSVNASDTWTVNMDQTPPTMSIAAVAPDPRSNTVSSILITFSEAVNGLDRDDLVLSRNGTNVSWTSQTLDPEPGSPARYTLNGLSSLTGAEGTYILTLKPTHGITDPAGNALANSPTESWLMDLTSPTATIAPPDLSSVVVITFSEPVSGLDLQGLSLARDGTTIAMSEPAQRVVPTPGGRIWTLIGLQSIISRLGSYVIAINAGAGIVDAAGNPLSGSPSANFITDTILGDQTPPIPADTIRLSVHDGDAALADVQVNSDAVYTVRLAGLSSIHIVAQGGEDNITLDFTRSSPLPAGGMFIDGGEGSDTLLVIGSDNSDSAALSTGSLSFNGVPVSFIALESLTLDTAAGDDSLIVDLENGVPIPDGGIQFDGGEGGDTLVVRGVPPVTELAVTADSATIGGLPISGASTEDVQVYLSGQTRLTALDISGGWVSLSGAGRTTLRTERLSLSSPGVLDMAESDLIVAATPDTCQAVSAQVAGWIAMGRENGGWIEAGLTTSEAGPFTGLAAMLNDRGNGVPILTEIEGIPVGPTDVIVKYSWNGDADLNGVIDADDYFRIDAGFLRRAGDYRNGDFDYDGEIGADDYQLIDAAFLAQSRPAGTQKAGLQAAVTGAFSQTNPATDTLEIIALTDAAFAAPPPPTSTIKSGEILSAVAVEARLQEPVMFDTDLVAPDVLKETADFLFSDELILA